MGLIYNRVFFNVKIEEVSCFYFCEHFYKAFKKKKPIKSASILQSVVNARKKFKNSVRNLRLYITIILTRQKKPLIQYYPIVKWKGVFVIDIKCIEPPIIILFKIMPVSSLFLCNISSPTNTFFSNVKIWEVSCFYFYPHFHRAFKGKNIIKDSVVLELYPYEEIIACCCACHKEISLIICSKFEDNLSDSFFHEIKKLFIQYFLLQR